MIKSISIIFLSTILAVMAFLFTSYFNNFVTKAEYNADKVIIFEMKKDIEYIKLGIDDLKRVKYEK